MESILKIENFSKSKQKHLYFNIISLSLPYLLIFLLFSLLAGSDHPPPVIRQGPLNQTIPVDSTVVLGCQTADSPPLTVHWKKDGAAVSPVDSRMSVADTGSLEIRYAKVWRVTHQIVFSSYSDSTESSKPTNVCYCTSCLQLGDTGFYTCVASSPNGEASWTAYLQVEGRSHILRRSRKCCEYTGRRPASGT